LAVFVFAFVALAAWQWDEYGRECEEACSSVAASADSIMNALVGGIRSHRRLGPFFSEQVQGMLDGLVLSKNVLAVALVSEDGKTVLSAGKRDLLQLPMPFVGGNRWTENGFLRVDVFPLPLEIGGPGSGRGGLGGGRGMGRAMLLEQDADHSPFSPGQKVAVMLLVDSKHATDTRHDAAWMRAIIIVAGWVVLVSAAVAWRSSIRLTEARGQAKTLETEARHFRDLSEAATGLAHETRNPLGLIRGWTQRLAETSDYSTENKKKAQAVLEECDRVTARINQFLAFARPTEPRLERFDATELVNELAVLLEPDLDAKQLSLEGPTVTLTILADRELLREALFNLLQNAVQASPEKETVSVSFVPMDGGRWRLEVADRGAGISTDVGDRVFTPYFTTRPDGTGLGLAIVQHIATAHGWTVDYAPRLGGGTIFRIHGIAG
jgi:signal transduction histidine kinase